MKLFKTTFLITVLAISYVSIEAMEGQPPRQNRPPCDISAVAQPTTKVRHIQYGWEGPIVYESLSPSELEILARKKEQEEAAEKAAIERQEARALHARTMKPLQQGSANVLIENLLQNLDDIDTVQNAVNSYALAIKTLLLDQIETKKALLDINNAEEKKKIEELNTLESIVNQALEKESKEAAKEEEESTEKEL